ncbi:hypothetical protein D3C81_08150 [compost metagenome]
MKILSCPKKGNKLAQEPNCTSETFTLFRDKTGATLAKCTECNTLYNIKDLKED